MKLSRQFRLLIAAAAIGLGGVSVAQAAVIDVVKAPTGYFVPTDAQKYDSPYYRWYGQDWSWTHSAIGGTITSAWLMISAFDVDAGASQPEVDEIWVGSTPVHVGNLAGANDIWAFSLFDVSAFATDIAAGLNVEIRIDTGTQSMWAVTLAKSQLCVNPENVKLECIGNPNPNPEPASLALMGLGLASLVAIRRRKTK